MDARTRERLPVLPTLRRTADQRRQDAAEVLDAARNTPIGQTFTAAGRTLRRIDSPRAAAVKVWAQNVGTGTRHDLVKQEEHAFWTYAAIEVLRATGIFSGGRPWGRVSAPGVCADQRPIVRF